MICLRSHSKQWKSRAFNAIQHFPNYTCVWKHDFESRLVNGRKFSKDKGLLGFDSFLIDWNKLLCAKQGSATGRTVLGWQPSEALM